MAKDRQPAVPIHNQIIYDQGRRARLNDADITDCPYTNVTDKDMDNSNVDDLKRCRSDWTKGWYDQHYGMKYEPNVDDIKTRIWPVHL